MKLKDRIVLITGGASGIGRIMGEIALKKGASALVIWDNQPGEYRCNNRRAESVW